MAMTVKEANVITRFAETIENLVNSVEKSKNTEAPLEEKRQDLSKLLEEVLLLIVKDKNRVITLLLRESPAELGKQVKDDIQNLRQQVDAALQANLSDGSDNEDFALELTFTRIVNNGRQLSQRLRDAVADGTEQNAVPAKIVNINNFGILGDVQAENVQTGDSASIHKHGGGNEKKKGILSRIPYWIYLLVSFLAALFACVHYWPEIQQKLQSLLSK